MTSTKNSLGLPMAMRKDWRDAVSSGGTDARSRAGEEAGAAAAGGPYAEFWPCERAQRELWRLCSLGAAAERSLGAFSLFSLSLPLPPDFVSSAPALLPLRFEPLLRLPMNKRGGGDTGQISIRASMHRMRQKSVRPVVGRLRV